MTNNNWQENRNHKILTHILTVSTWCTCFQRLLNEWNVWTFGVVLSWYFLTILEIACALQASFLPNVFLQTSQGITPTREDTQSLPHFLERKKHPWKKVASARYKFWTINAWFGYFSQNHEWALHKTKSEIMKQYLTQFHMVFFKFLL